MQKALSFLVVFFAVVLFGTSALAGDRPTELGGGFAFSDNDDVGDQYTLRFSLDFPLSDHFQFGPALQMTHFDPEPSGVSSVDTYALGGTLTLNFMDSESGLFGAATALYHDGDVGDESITLTPQLGVKLYKAGGGLRIAIGYPYQFNEDEDDLISLETTEVRADFVMLF